jgi:hypothetical protein
METLSPCSSHDKGAGVITNGCQWLDPILSRENSGWCITTEVSFLGQNILILVIILVVKKVKSNDRQFTGANMTCF